MRKWKFLLAVAVVATGAVAFTFQKDDSLARVNRIQGVYVFVQCEPVQDYDVVGDKTTKFGTALMGKQSIDDQLQSMIKRGRKDLGDDAFDGVITQDGEIGTFIKFKE
ncbi:hypothetical protein [Ekhidna sp.]|jgi:hypothetical protein|uniref:hypothetical protein n=1 Tax=Ekhidna sp. TaxID=2608089 RepID=UPI0032ECF684